MSSIWFDGPINDAVQLVNAKNCLFIVFIHNLSENSDKLNDIILDSSLQEVLKDHVIIKLEYESDNAKLFGQLYPIHRVPMVYFIKQGVIKDFAIETTSAEEIMDKITKLLITEPTFGLSSSPTLNNTTNSVSSSSTPTLSSTPASTPITSTTNNDDNIPLTTTTHNDSAKEKEAKEKLKKQMELARQKREEKEKKDAKEREIKRRQDGKEALETRQQLENKQNKLYFEKIKKEKQADEEHRRKIKEQIARDREEKQSLLKQKKQQQPSSINNDVSSSPSPSPSPSREYDECHLNIRQTDGKNNRQKFKANDTLGDVRQWIDTNRTDGEQPYKLLSQFPTRHFSVGDEEKTLQQLNLLPSATVIMKSIKNVSNAYQPNQSGGVIDYAYSAGGLLYNAVSGVGTTLTGFVGGFFNGIPSDQPIQQQGQQSSSSSLFSNTSPPVHGQRLGGSSSSNSSNNSRFNTLRQSEFDDDENKKKRTYNGNSVNQE
ncbi:hypothetical protein BJ944DRAFT_242953 [Cunninghamella echinulata]|nr:hypothetical protein BJ944DRAFT_242953 [Cunninghamella echinulata]